MPSWRLAKDSDLCSKGVVLSRSDMHLRPSSFQGPLVTPSPFKGEMGGGPTIYFSCGPCKLYAQLLSPIWLLWICYKAITAILPRGSPFSL